MTTKIVTVKNALGLHARAAGTLAKHTQSYTCRAEAVKGDERHSLKSIMDVLLMGCIQGEELRLEFDGPDEKQAAEAIEALFEEGFGEPD